MSTPHAGRRALRRLGVAVAAAAVPAVVLTGCAGTQTSGHALPDTAGTTGTQSACASTGASADAAGATVHCYLGALAASDTSTACSVLSQRVREHIADDAAGGSDPAFHVPDGGSQGLDSDCSTVAPLMARALSALSGAELEQFRVAVRQVTVGTASVAGDTATLTITASRSGRSASQSISLVQDSGRWKIDSTGAFSLAS